MYKDWKVIALGLGLGLMLEMPLARAQTEPPAPLSPESAAKLEVLDRFRGIWSVTVKSRQPKVPDITYTQTNDWVLGHRFMRGDTGRKSDKSQDVSMITYDAAARGYPLWIFSSSGAALYLAPGSWDEASRTMHWKNPPFVPVIYRLDCDYSDPNKSHCVTLVKTMVGKVLLDQESTAVRRP